MTLSRMELCDAEQTVPGILAALLAQFPSIPIPMPIEEVARDLDITQIAELTTPGFEGALLFTKDRPNGRILVSRNGPKTRQRFTIGHELAHFLCDWHVPKGNEGFYCTSDDLLQSNQNSSVGSKKMEAEANQFSIGLLMPADCVKQDIRKIKEIDLQNIVRLAEKYDVSKLAAARRYSELATEPCAFVISKDRQFQRAYRHDQFPYIDIKPNQPMPNNMPSMKTLGESGSFSSWYDTEGDLWFSANKSNSTRLHEQTYFQQDGYSITLLIPQDSSDFSDSDDDSTDPKTSFRPLDGNLYWKSK